MFRNRLKLFTLAGFKVYADLTWLLIVGLIAWSLATSLFPAMLDELSTGWLWVMGTAGALGLFASIVLHELAHSLVARRYGTEIAGITLFLFGGVAEMKEEPRSPRAELWTAIAGPITSIVLGGLLLLAVLGGEALALADPILVVLAYLGWLNLVLAAFNLIPAFPLDGGRVLRSILWARKGSLAAATRTSARIGAAFGAGLIALGLVSLLFGNLVGGLWWALIGLFLRGAAKASAADVVTREALKGEPVGRFTRPDLVQVPADLPLKNLVEDYVYRWQHKAFPVTDGERVVGVVGTDDLKRVPKEEWADTAVRDVARPIEAGENAVRADAPAIDALRMLGRDERARLLVVDEEGHYAGMVWLKDLLAFLELKIELEGRDDGQADSRKRTRKSSATPQAWAMHARGA